MKGNNDIKTMEVIKNILIYFNLPLSMVFVAAVDSLSTMTLVMGMGILAFLWYLVKLVDDKIDEMKEVENV